jgi:hypothetical protein
MFVARPNSKMKILTPILCCLALALILPGGPAAHDSFATYDDVEQVVRSLKDELPPQLQTAPRENWPMWLSTHDREIRKRLRRGDEDTLINWLLFGTSFTQEPRPLFDVAETSRSTPRIISRRAHDLIAAIRSAHPDERRLFARSVLSDAGYGFGSAIERDRVEQHLLSEVERVLAERRQYAMREDSYQPGDFAGQMLAQSRLFRDRGLSLDTSILPAFAIEQALETMKSQHLLLPDTIRRVAVIGPGLDFADKNSGYDFYPVQTLQPFTTIDSLLRLGLSAGPAEIQLTTFDISSRVNDHILWARNRAAAGSPYVLRLSMQGGVQWAPALLAYWRRAGDRIGFDAALPTPAELDKRFEIRTIEVRPQITAKISAEDFNVVTERWTGPPFDLVIATNVLVYYDKLEQALALADIETMLRPGGFFLTNNVIVEAPVSRLRSVGFRTVQHAADSVDHIFWYRKL